MISVWRNSTYLGNWDDTSPRTTGSYIALRTTDSSVRFDNIKISSAGDGFLYLHSDHLGSTSLMTYQNSTYVNDSRSYYLPFGGYRGTPPTANPAIADRGYTGHKHNNDVGLIYMNARFYVPSINRFASADTLVPEPDNPQSYNRYSYVLNNPIRYTDPSGHCAGIPDVEATNPDTGCWNLLLQLENTWDIDIQDEALWELFHLETLQQVLKQYADYLGGDKVFKGVLTRSAKVGGFDKFVVRGQFGNSPEWAICTTGCSSFGQVRFDLNNTFAPNPNAAGLFDNRNDITAGLFDAARILMAHEFAHILLGVLPAKALTDYDNARGWDPLLGAWIADNNATTIFDGPDHHLVRIIALHVAGGETWRLVPTAAKMPSGRIPLEDRIFVKNDIPRYLP